MPAQAHGILKFIENSKLHIGMPPVASGSHDNRLEKSVLVYLPTSVLKNGKHDFMRGFQHTFYRQLAFELFLRLPV